MNALCLFTALLLSQFIYGQDITSVTDFSQYIGESKKITAQAETEKYFWVGTNNGLYCIRKKNKKTSHYTTENSVLPADSITSIAVKPNGEVFVGTYSGIMRYDNFAFLLINTENSSLASNKITSLACINGNEIFAGTMDAGLTVFSGSGSKNFNKLNAPLSTNHIIAFEKTGDNDMMIVMENDAKIAVHEHQFNMVNANKH